MAYAFRLVPTLDCYDSYLRHFARSNKLELPCIRSGGRQLSEGIDGEVHHVSVYGKVHGPFKHPHPVGRDIVR